RRVTLATPRRSPARGVAARFFELFIRDAFTRRGRDGRVRGPGPGSAAPARLLDDRGLLRTGQAGRAPGGLAAGVLAAQPSRLLRKVVRDPGGGGLLRWLAHGASPFRGGRTAAVDVQGKCG